MQFVDKSSVSEPDWLRSSEVERAKFEISEYLSDIEERQAQRRAPYNPSLLSEKRTLSATLKLFHNSCAYCEKPLESYEKKSLSHHRPRVVSDEGRKKRDERFYAWLSYDWQNVIPVCKRCEHEKRNRFPVKGARGEMGQTVETLRTFEGELLLDPCYHDPSRHLRFHCNGHVEALKGIGQETINLLLLNSHKLVAGRKRSVRKFADSLRLDLVTKPDFSGLEDSPASYSFVFDMNTGKRLKYPGALTNAILWAAGEFFATNYQNAHELFGALAGLKDAKRQEFASYLVELSDKKGIENVSSEHSDLYKSKTNRNFSLSDSSLSRAQISSVAIENFKAVKDIEFTLPAMSENRELVPSMLILGENATGKSSVLEAITLAILGTNETAELDSIVRNDDIRPSEMLHRPDPENWDIISEQPLNVQVEFHSELDARVSLYASEQDSKFRGHSDTSKVLLAYGPRRFFKSRSRRFRAPAYRVKSLFDPLDTIPNPISWLVSLSEKNRSRFDDVISAMRDVLMLDKEAMVRPENGRVMIETPNGKIPLSKMSVGYKSVLAMALDIARELYFHYDTLQDAYATVVIDEIETHLHPRWKMQIISLLRNAFPKVQFVMSTHDPLCLRGMFDGEVFVLTRDEAAGNIEVLKELPSITGMRAEQILTSEYFGLGTTDPATESKVIRYQTLAVKDELSSAETAEKNKLAEDLKTDMRVGDNFAQQVFYQLLSEQKSDPFEKFDKTARSGRRKLMEGLLANFTDEEDAEDTGTAST